MKPVPIMIISSLAGGAVAILVSTFTKNNQEAEYQNYLYQQTLQQISEAPRSSIPAAVGVTPLDATPTVGFQEEPGSIRPQIQYKNAYIRVKRTDQKIKETGDPIWHVELVSDNQVLEKLDALIGRANKQTANRHTAGSKSPLPIGEYQIDRPGIARPPFDDPELGRGYWVPVSPLFTTGRSALGFHQDPSWGRMNGESGTSGCIGLKSPEDTAKLVTWIKHFNIKTVNVES